MGVPTLHDIEVGGYQAIDREVMEAELGLALSYAHSLQSSVVVFGSLLGSDEEENVNASLTKIIKTIESKLHSYGH